MHVRAYHNDGLTYLVDSSSRKGNHMVHLGAYKGLGSCSCEAHSMTLVPKFKASGYEISDTYRCKHIKAAREYLTNEVIRKLSPPSLPTPRRTEAKEAAQGHPQSF